MSDFIITTRSPPRRNVVRTDQLHYPNTVRTFRASPQDGILQLRLRKEYISISLNSAEFREIAAAMIAVADDIEGAGK